MPATEQQARAVCDRTLTTLTALLPGVQLEPTMRTVGGQPTLGPLYMLTGASSRPAQLQLALSRNDPTDADPARCVNISNCVRINGPEGYLTSVLDVLSAHMPGTPGTGTVIGHTVWLYRPTDHRHVALTVVDATTWLGNDRLPPNSPALSPMTREQLTQLVNDPRFNQLIDDDTHILQTH